MTTNNLKVMKLSERAMFTQNKLEYFYRIIVEANEDSPNSYAERKLIMTVNKNLSVPGQYVDYEFENGYSEKPCTLRLFNLYTMDGKGYNAAQL